MSLTDGQKKVLDELPLYPLCLIIEDLESTSPAMHYVTFALAMHSEFCRPNNVVPRDVIHYCRDLITEKGNECLDNTDG